MADDNEKQRQERSDLEKIAAILIRHKAELLDVGSAARHAG